MGGRWKQRGAAKDLFWRLSGWLPAHSVLTNLIPHHHQHHLHAHLSPKDRMADEGAAKTKILRSRSAAMGKTNDLGPPIVQ